MIVVSLVTVGITLVIEGVFVMLGTPPGAGMFGGGVSLLVLAFVLSRWPELIR